MGLGTEDGSPFGAKGSGFRPHSEVAGDTEDAVTTIDVVGGAEGQGCLGTDLTCISTEGGACLLTGTGAEGNLCSKAEVNEGPNVPPLHRYPELAGMPVQLDKASLKLRGRWN